MEGRKLVEGENGKKVRMNAGALSNAARQARKEGPTSYNIITGLIDKLYARQT